MKDPHDRETINLLGDTQMPMYQVNYKYLHANGKIRSGAMATEAKDVTEAKKNAAAQLKTEHDKFEITSIKEWK